MMVEKNLPVDLIRMDGGTQVRVGMSQDTIDEYAATVADFIDRKKGWPFPEIVVFEDPDEADTYWLADGFHRLYSAKQAKRGSVPCEVHSGGQRDALVFAFTANNKNGLRLNNADKRRAVELALEHTELCKLSARKLSELIGVSHQFVLNIQKPPPAKPPKLGMSTVDSQSAGGNSEQPKTSGTSSRSGVTESSAAVESQDGRSAAVTQRDAAPDATQEAVHQDSQEPDASETETDASTEAAGVKEYTIRDDGTANYAFEMACMWQEVAIERGRPAVDIARELVRKAPEPSKSAVRVVFAQDDLAPVKPKKPRAGGFEPPTIVEVQAYLNEKGWAGEVDAEAFVDHYESQGWKKANGQKVTKWEGCITTFRKNKDRFGRNGKGDPDPRGTVDVVNQYLDETGGDG